MLGANPAMDWHPRQGVEILLVASSTMETGNKRRPDHDGPLGSNAEFTSCQGWFLKQSLDKWGEI